MDGRKAKLSEFIRFIFTDLDDAVEGEMTNMLAVGLEVESFAKQNTG